MGYKCVNPRMHTLKLNVTFFEFYICLYNFDNEQVLHKFQHGVRASQFPKIFEVTFPLLFR